jgi:hypothetical protein
LSGWSGNLLGLLWADPGPDRTRSPKTSASQSGPAQERLDHAAFRARTSEIGIGAAVLNARAESGQRIWDRIVSDGEQWH